MKPSDKTLMAFARMKNSPEFHEILAYLEGTVESLRKDSDTDKDEISYRWNQGKRQILTEVIHFAKTAGDKLKQIEQGKE